MKTFDFKQETVESILNSDVVMFTYHNKLNNYCVGKQAIIQFLSKVQQIPFLYETLTIEEYNKRMI